MNRRPMARLLQMEDVPNAATRERVLQEAKALTARGIEVVHLSEARALSTQGAAGSVPIYVERTVLGQTTYQPLHEVSVLLERYNQVFTIESLYCEPEHYEVAAAALLPLVEPAGRA